MAIVRDSNCIDNLEVKEIDAGGNYAYNKDMTCLFVAVRSVTAIAVSCDVTKLHDRNTAVLLCRVQLSKTYENEKFYYIAGNNEGCNMKILSC
jgi:hypothetical protein